MTDHLHYAKNYITQLTLVLIVFIIFVAALVKLFIIPCAHRLHAQQKEEVVLKQKYIHQFQQQLDYDFIKLQSQELSHRFAIVLTKIKKPPSINNIMTQVTASVHSQTLQLLHIAPLVESKTILQVNLRGSFTDFIQWLNQLIQLPWFFRFDQIQIQEVPNSVALLIELQLETCHF